MLSRVYTKNGWVTGYSTNEGPKLVPDSGIDISQEVVDLVDDSNCLYYDPVNGLCHPQDDRIAWKALRSKGHDGAESRGILTNISESIRALPDVPSGITDPEFESTVHPMTPVGDIIDVPGLRITPFTHNHLDSAAALAIETGLHPAVCPGVSENHPRECSPPESHAWMEIARRIDAPNRMALAVEYKGTPLQLEIFRLDGVSATVGFTVHFTRERPHWFWREAEKPVFDALRVMGVNKLFSYTRSDRPDWIQSLKDNYGAIEVSTTANNTVLEFPLTGYFQGWPQRRTAGAGWTWEQDKLIVREATEAEIPDVLAMIDATYPVLSPQIPIAKKMVDWWWNLDKSALLIGIEDGVITHARLIRPRRGTVSGVGMISLAGALTGPFVDGMRAWQAAVGYTKGTMFIPERMLASPEVQKALDDTKLKGTIELVTHTKFRENFVEIEWNCP